MLRKSDTGVQQSILSHGIMVLLAVLLLMYPQTSSAAILFADDFETPGWTPKAKGWYYNRFGKAGDGTVTTNNPAGGAHSFQMDWLANQTRSIYLEKSVPTSDLYTRFYVFWSPGFQFLPGGTQQKKVFRTRKGGDSVLTVKGRSKFHPPHVTYKFRRPAT